MAFAETADLAVRLSLKDGLSKGLATASKNLGRFDKATSNTQRALSNTGRNLERLATVGLAATAAGLIGVVRAAADYESAFAGVRKTVEATEPQLQALSDAFREMARTIPISASELARLGEAGGALGIATKDLQEFVRVTALLGETTDLTSDQAAESLGILSNVLKLTSKDYGQFASALVALGNAGASTESQIIGIAQRMGAAGELIGLSTEQVLGFSSAVASIGIEVEAGGSALQKFFIDTTKQVAGAGDELKILAKTAGKTSKQFADAYNKDAGKALQDFLAGLGKLDKASQLNVLEDLGFNDVRITRTLLGLANNTALVADQMGVANSAFKENTALTKEAEQRFKTFDSQLRITKNVLTDIGITIGSKLLPKLVPLLQRLNAFISANQGKIEQFGTDLAEGFGKFADEISRTDFTPLIDGLKTTLAIAKTAIDLFKALPAPIQKLLIAGAAVNKVTGGLVTGLGKDILGGILGRFRGQTPAAPMFVKEVGLAGGVLGGKGAKGGVAGAAAGVGSALAKVFIIGAAVGVFSELIGVLKDQSKANAEQTSELKTQTGKFADQASQKDLRQSIIGVQNEQRKLLSELSAQGIAFDLNIDGVKTTVRETITKLSTQLQLNGIQEHAAAERADANAGTSKAATDLVRQSVENATSAVDKVAQAVLAGKTATELAGIQAHAAEERADARRAQQQAAVNNLRNLTNTAVGIMASVRANTGATRTAVGAATQAIRAKKWSVTVKNSITSQAITYINGRAFIGAIDRQYVIVKPGQPSVAF